MLSGSVTLGLALVGGCVGLDRTAFSQAGLARPLVGASVAGWVVGEPVLGLWCGALLELLWLAEAPVGAHVPPDEALAGVLAAVFAWAAPADWSIQARVALGVVLAVPAGCLGRWLDMGIRRWNDGLVARARRGVSLASPGAIGRAHLLGTARFFGAGVFGAVVLSHGGVAVIRWGLTFAPPGLEQGLELAAILLPALGAASVLAGWRGRRQVFRFVLGAVAGAVGFRFLESQPWRR